MYSSFKQIFQINNTFFFLICQRFSPIGGNMCGTADTTLNGSFLLHPVLRVFSLL